MELSKHFAGCCECDLGCKCPEFMPLWERCLVETSAVLLRHAKEEAAKPPITLRPLSERLQAEVPEWIIAQASARMADALVEEARKRYKMEERERFENGNNGRGVRVNHRAWCKTQKDPLLCSQTSDCGAPTHYPECPVGLEDKERARVRKAMGR